MTTIAYVGNFGPEHSTENHVARDAESLGYEVLRWQENDPDTWDRDPAEADLILWTRTGWDWRPLYGSAEAAWEVQQEFLVRAAAAGVPVAGFHLDRWFGLDRQHQVDDEPFFTVDVLFTADGGHDEEWVRRGIDHRWLPPAVSAVEARREGRERAEYRADVAFVGSWQRYHAEYPERRALVEHLRRRYRNRAKVWPRGRTAVRGQALADLYRTAKILVGDSCLVPAVDGSPIVRYWSDRIPETLGRGGFLLHPYVPGIEDQFVDGKHLRLYEPGNYAEVDALINHYLAHDAERREIAAAGRAHVLDHHTYEHRIETIVTTLNELADPSRRRRGRISARFDLRPGSTDEIVVDEIWTEDVYRLAPADLEGRTVVDLGANVGAFSIFAALSGANGVHAYEPGAGNREALERNLAVNGLDDGRVVVWPEAAWEENVDEVVFVGGWLGGEGGSYTHDVDPIADDDGVRVPAVSLDRIVERAGHVGVLKIDTEGAEAAILLGASEETWARIDRIVMEFHGTGTGGALGEGEWATMVEVLAERGHVRVLGRPSNGGTIWWETYR